MVAHKHVQRQTTIATPVRMLLTTGLAEIPAQATFSYTPDEPFAITMSVCAGHSSPVVWLFARDLLLDGRERPAGLGDVHIFPAGNSIVIDLMSPDGHARLRADPADIDSFVSAILSLVPAGREQTGIDLDAQLALLTAVPYAQRRDQ